MNELKPGDLVLIKNNYPGEKTFFARQVGFYHGMIHVEKDTVGIVVFCWPAAPYCHIMFGEKIVILSSNTLIKVSD